MTYSLYVNVETEAPYVGGTGFWRIIIGSSSRRHGPVTWADCRIRDGVSECHSTPRTKMKTRNTWGSVYRI